MIERSNAAQNSLHHAQIGPHERNALLVAVRLQDGLREAVALGRVDEHDGQDLERVACVQVVDARVQTDAQTLLAVRRHYGSLEHVGQEQTRRQVQFNARHCQCRLCWLLLLLLLLFGNVVVVLGFCCRRFCCCCLLSLLDFVCKRQFGNV